MGVWGPGNFDNDYAGDFLDEFLLSIVERVRVSLFGVDNQDFSIDDDFDGTIMVCIEILIALCEKFNHPTIIDPLEIERWKSSCLTVFDKNIEYTGAKPDYKTKRRKVIEDTFDSLLKLSHLYE